MEQNISAVRRLFTAIETGDVSTAQEFLSPDYENRESLDDGRSTLRGPAEFAETTAWLRQLFSDLHFEEQECIASGDKVVMRVLMHGMHTGEFFGLSPTGKRFEQKQIHIFRCVDGLVREHRAQRDDLGLRLYLMEKR